MKSKLFFITCIACCALAVYYFSCVAENRFMSKSQFSIIVDDNTAADTSANLMSLLGGEQGAASPDSQSTVGFILSADLLLKLEKEFNLAAHYQTPKDDIIFKLKDDALLEERLEHYRKRIKAQFNSTTGLIELTVETYDAELSYKLSQRILQDTEHFINSLNKKVANERLNFVQEELDRAQTNVEKHEKLLLEFQNEHKIIQPEVIIAARLEAIQSLRLEKINKEIRLSTIKASSNNSPLIPQLIASINKLEEEITTQEERLSGEDQQKLNNLLAEYKALQNDLDFSLKLREGAEILREQTRAEGISKSRFFSVIQNPHIAEYSENPRRVYLSCSFVALIALSFYILKAILKSITDRS